MAEAIKRVFRCDAVGELAKPVRMENGYLKLDGRIARVGLQEYEDDDGTTHMELRTPEEVFDPESMASFHMVAVTNEHPPIMLDDKNTGQYQRGQVGENVRKLDETWLGATMMLTDGDTVRSVESGSLAQLSNGYTAVLVAISELAAEVAAALTAKWGAFKFLQTKIRGNHLALVSSARAGPNARVRLDSNGNAHVSSHSAVRQSPPERQPMKTIRIDGISYEMTEGNAGTIEAALEKAIQKQDAARVAAEGTAATSAAKLKIVKDNALRLIKDKKALRAVLDAMKLKGKFGALDMDDDGNMTMALPGGISMHMPKSKATGVEEGSADGDEMGTCEEGDGDEDISEMLGDPDEDMDENELETQQQTEEEAGAAAKKGDAKARAKRKEDSRKLVAAFLANFRSHVDRSVRARAVLEATARRFTGDTDLAKLDSDGIRKAVISVLSPKAKTDGKKPADIRATFDALVEAAGESTVTASAAATALTSPFYVATKTDAREATKEDGSHLTGYERMLFNQSKQDAALRGNAQ